MLKDISMSAAALYDGGWRSTDKDQMMDEYGLAEQEAEAICERLAEYAGEKGAKMKKVELLGLDIEVEFDEAEIFEYTEDDGEKYEAAVTTDRRLIAWDDGSNSWVQLKRWA